MIVCACEKESVSARMKEKEKGEGKRDVRMCVCVRVGVCECVCVSWDEHLLRQAEVCQFVRQPRFKTIFEFPAKKKKEKIQVAFRCGCNFAKKKLSRR